MPKYGMKDATGYSNKPRVDRPKPSGFQVFVREGEDPMKAYRHNKIIKRLFDKARRNAFAKTQTHPEVRKLKGEKIKRDLEARKILNQTTNRNIKETQIRNLLQN